ncbi:MAG: NUDIX hydrolase [Solobacterium sp.]|nr:NUDIX hydrolase [Solobacterium sp.]
MEEVNAKGQTLKEFLEEYDETKYRRPSNTVDMILMTVSQAKLKLLLIRRKDHPFINDWALPGGFINFDEDMETAVLRELQEETNITDHTYFRQLYTFGKTDRDPRTRIITTAYLSLTPEENIRHTRAGDDAADAGWFRISKNIISTDGNGRSSQVVLECEDNGVRIVYDVYDRVNQNYIHTDSKLNETESNAKLAADHIKAVNMAMDQVQHRAASTGILFNLLPLEFTLREVQNAYEAVIGKKTDTGNFRRDIRKMLNETGTKKKVNGKYAALYRFNPLYSYMEENL